MLFGNLLCGTTDSPLAPGLAVQLCLLHPRQYISLCISQNTLCFGISGCSCTAVNVRPWLFDMRLATVCMSTYGPVYGILFGYETQGCA